MSSTETAIQKYGSVDLDAVEEEINQLKKEKEESKGRRPFLKLDEGATSVRVAPPWSPAAKIPFKKVWLHQLKDPSNLDSMAKFKVACNLKNETSRSCLICKKVGELRRTGDQMDKDIAYAWSSVRKYYAQVVMKEKVEDGWLLWEMSRTAYNELLKIMRDPDSGGDFTNPVEGYDLIIDRTGKGKFDTRYSYRLSRKSSEFPKMELLNDMMNLDVMSKEVTDEQAQAFLNELTGESLPPPVNEEDNSDAVEADFEDSE